MGKMGWKGRENGTGPLFNRGEAIGEREFAFRGGKLGGGNTPGMGRIGAMGPIGPMTQRGRRLEDEASTAASARAPPAFSDLLVQALADHAGERAWTEGFLKEMESTAPFEGFSHEIRAVAARKCHAQ